MVVRIQQSLVLARMLARRPVRSDVINGVTITRNQFEACQSFPINSIIMVPSRVAP